MSTLPPSGVNSRFFIAILLSRFSLSRFFAYFQQLEKMLSMRSAQRQVGLRRLGNQLPVLAFSSALSPFSSVHVDTYLMFEHNMPYLCPRHRSVSGDNDWCRRVYQLGFTKKTRRAPVEGKSSVCRICMKFIILILIIIIISLGQILLPYIANTSRTHGCPCTRAHACASTHTRAHTHARTHALTHTHRRRHRRTG